MDSVKDEVDCKAITTEEKGKVLEESKKKLPAKKTSRTLDKKGFDKKELDAFKKDIGDELMEHVALLEKFQENHQVMVDSLNQSFKRLDAIEKQVGELLKENQKGSDIKLLSSKVDEMEEDVGSLIDKVDVLFVGGDSDGKDADIRSKVEKLENVIYSRLHKRA